MNEPTRRAQIAALRTQVRAERERRLYVRPAAGILTTAVIVPLIVAGVLKAGAGVVHSWWH